MSKVVKFGDGKDFRPRPPTKGGKLGRSCPRWPKELKVAALGCAVAMAGTEEALERDRGWAVMGLRESSLAKAVDQVLPGKLMAHAEACGYSRDEAEEYLFNRLYRMFNWERKRAPNRWADRDRGARSEEHVFNWPDKAEWMALYEHAMQFGTKTRRQR